MKINVGAKIRYFQKRLFLSQEALAFKANIHPAYLGKLERNEKNPTIGTLEKIISAIGISYGEFFSDDLENETNEERAFYINTVTSSLTSLPDDKLKAVADGIVRIMDAVK